MHKLAYLQNNEYQCLDCGQFVNRDDVTAFQTTDCEGQRDIITMNRRLALFDASLSALTESVKKLQVRVKHAESTLASLTSVTK